MTMLIFSVSCVIDTACGVEKLMMIWEKFRQKLNIYEHIIKGFWISQSMSCVWVASTAFNRSYPNFM